MKNIIIRQTIMMIIILPVMLFATNSIVLNCVGVLYVCAACICVRKYDYVRRFLHQCYRDVLRIESTIKYDKVR